MGDDAAVNLQGHRGRTWRRASAVQPEISIPNLEELGLQEFTGAALQSLIQSLQDARWPRGTLNIFALEGLLTALLVLPLGLRPGSWLPLIWNGSGWRLPEILHERERFDGFIVLLMGFMRAIDQGLLETPPRFASMLDHGDAPIPADRARQDWAHGFGLALKACPHIRVPSGSTVHRALCSIAAHSHASVTTRPGYLSPPSIQDTVLLLASTRTSRGPLGRLVNVKPAPVKSKSQ